MPTTFANTINGNPIYAARAESDKNGDRIDTTYAKLSDIPPGVTVDQTYDASSTNAQSGTAVAEAVQALDAEVTSSDGTNVQVKVTETNGKVTAVNITTDNTESKFNKKQSINDSSTTDFPSSKAVADFVNSSVATATARFLCSFTLTDLGLTYGSTNAQIATALDNHAWPSGTTPTNNDYVYVEIENPQTTGIDDEVRRFKFNGTVWAYEYTLNNSSFTAAEKAAIDSGITATAVTTYNGHVADSTIHVTSSDKSAWNAKQDAISDLATIRSGASAGATAIQPGDLATVATTGSYNDLLNKPTIPAAVTVDQTYNSSSTNAQSGTAVADALSGINQVPASTSSDEDKVLTVDSNGDPVWAPAQGGGGGGGSQVQADWTETDTTDPSYIQNKPAQKTLAAGGGIAISESNNAVTISESNPLPASTILDENKTLIVDSNGAPTWSNSVPLSSDVHAISLVNSLPANPVSGTLYLIPET